MDGFCAIFQFLPQAGSRSKNQVGMIIGVIADRMSGLLNGADDVRALAHVFSNQEKCCPGIMFSQQIEQMQSVRIVGAIIVGEEDLPWIAAMRQCAAIKLRPRRHGGVSGITGGRGSRKTCKSQEHWVMKNLVNG